MTAPVKAFGDSQLCGGDDDLHEFNELWGWDYGTLPLSRGSKGTVKGEIEEGDEEIEEEDGEIENKNGEIENKNREIKEKDKETEEEDREEDRDIEE